MTSDLSHLEDILRRHNAKSFIKAVTGARAENTQLILTLQAFYREPELLYTALVYASARGVAVTMAPEHDDADHTFEF
ncbi:hypothetical protein [Amycolatopsis samaneae]|uniref:Uncharacterized protein n=1 Tax=Amycolatopsis samaneae TaxID=664691 RepID=A0ABW5GTN9_9PSEU